MAIGFRSVSRAKSHQFLRSTLMFSGLDLPFQQLRPGHDPMAAPHRGKNIIRHRIGQNDHTVVLERERAAKPGGKNQLFQQPLIGPVGNRPFKPRSDRIRERLIVSADVKSLRRDRQAAEVDPRRCPMRTTSSTALPALTPACPLGTTEPVGDLPDETDLMRVR